MRHFLRRLWKCLEDFEACLLCVRLTEGQLQLREHEELSRDTLLAAISEVFPRAGGNMRRSLLRRCAHVLELRAFLVRLLSTVVTEDGSRGFKSASLEERLFLGLPRFRHNPCGVCEDSLEGGK